MRGRTVVPLEKKLWPKVNKTRRCWIWNGNRNQDGYGMIGHCGTTMSTHRVAWILTNGKIPPGMLVCHKCDNPPCVRPSHLFLGTYHDNAIDRDRKGRQALGARNGKSKITATTAKKIRDEYFPVTKGRRNPVLSMVKLAKKYGVSGSCVFRIISGSAWSHVK